MKPTAESFVWQDALLAARILAVDPSLGASIKAGAGPVRELWRDYFLSLVDPKTPIVKVPANVDEEALVGGLDVIRTVELKKRAYTTGLISRAMGGLIFLAMAERLREHATALLTQAFDRNATFGIIAFDEGIGVDEALSSRLTERLAFQIYLDELAYPDCQTSPTLSPISLADTRLLIKHIELTEEVYEGVLQASQVLGIDSIRAGLFAIRTIRVIAALRGDTQVTQADIQTGSRLVFGHRMTQIPQSSEDLESSEDDQMDAVDEDLQEPSQERLEENQHADSENQEEQKEEPTPPQMPSKEQLEEIIIEAVKANMPSGLLNELSKNKIQSKTKQTSLGKAGSLQKSVNHGQPLVSRKGKPRSGQRIDFLKTLQAASPWQMIRRQDGQANPSPQKTQFMIRSDDIYLRRYQQRSTTVTIFVVDASGSSAHERLAEAKGAIELLLADCYIRRDQVAMVSFRVNRAELVLPPTRSLVRAKRLLSSMLGGGGTPLAIAIHEAHQIATTILAKGQTPVLILMTDGRANVSLAGMGGREAAQRDATHQAQRVRLGGYQTLFIDTSITPQDLGRQLAFEMGAKYVPLPRGKSNQVVAAAKQLFV